MTLHSDLEKRFSELKNSIKTMIDHHQKIIQEKEEVCEILTKKLEDVEMECEDLKEKLSELENKFDNMESECVDNENTIVQLEEEIKILKNSKKSSRWLFF